MMGDPDDPGISEDRMRLIDLHCNWALQYARESSQYDPGFYEGITGRLGQLDGYLMGTRATVLTCGRRAEDWAVQAEPWQVLGEMIARYEAEFPGRLLHGPDDVARWDAEPEDGLCWGVLGVEGFDVLVRKAGDLDRLAGLFARGVRVFQLVETGASPLGGSAAPGDDRGLTDLGRLFLERLLDLSPAGGAAGPRPAVDLADLNGRTTADVLDWFEAEPARRERLLLVRSHGPIDRGGQGPSSGLAGSNLGRLRALGGDIGLGVGATDFASAEDLRSAIESVASTPFDGRAGYEGIGVGTDFLNTEPPLPGCHTVDHICGWLSASFGADAAEAISSGNARGLLLRAAGFMPAPAPAGNR
jgi:membrane dipeptidase